MELKPFENFIDEHQGLVRTVVRGLLKHPAYQYTDAKDIEQMVMYSSWIAWGYYQKHIEEEGEPRAKFGTYLSTTLKRGMKEYSDIAFVPQAEIIPDIHAGYSPIDGVELTDLIDNTLDNRERHILYERILGNKTLKDCANVWCITIERARQIQNKALAKLLECDQE